jgi:hypothetical protein
MSIDLSTGAHDFEAYVVGIVSASACTSLPDDEAAARMNAVNPTDISSRWEIADDETFGDGTPHPCPCQQNP